MIILKIILWIVVIASVVGVVALIADLLNRNKGSHKPYGPYERFLKRPLDAFLATGALIVLSPVLLITAILVRVKLGSPVLFTHARTGDQADAGDGVLTTTGAAVDSVVIGLGH